MRHQSGLDSQAKLQTPPEAILQREFPPGTSGPRRVAARPEFSIGELAFRVLVAFRVHPHLSNVLTSHLRCQLGEGGAVAQLDF